MSAAGQRPAAGGAALVASSRGVHDGPDPGAGVLGSLGRVWAIALNTAREAVRNRVLYVLVAFVVALMGFSVVLGELSLGEEVRVIKDLGLAGISLFGTIIALFLGVNLLSKELDKKTVYAVIPKPLHRWEFLLGKFAGLAVTLVALVALMSLALAGFVAAEGGVHGVLLVRAELLIALELLLLTAVALLFSSFSSPYLSAMFTAGVWIIGRNTTELRAFAEGKLDGTTTGQLIAAVAAVVPDFHLFYVSGGTLDDGHVATIHETFVSWGYVAGAGGYAALYAAACLVLATLIFARRDFT
jgi:ABC-type transport system involved in multi-copper enzyme maturation permease subunit